MKSEWIFLPYLCWCVWSRLHLLLPLSTSIMHYLKFLKLFNRSHLPSSPPSPSFSLLLTLNFQFNTNSRNLLHFMTSAGSKFKTCTYYRISFSLFHFNHFTSHPYNMIICWFWILKDYTQVVDTTYTIQTLPTLIDISIYICINIYIEIHLWERQRKFT